MTADVLVDATSLERRRRLTLRWAAFALLGGILSCLIGLSIGGTDNSDTIGGAFIVAGIAGVVAAPWIVHAWQTFMQRRMVAASVAGRPDIRHIDGDQDRRGSEAALSSAAFELGAFRDSGLVEAFESASMQHVLTGDAQSVPFGIAEIALHDAKNYAVFSGVLASFRLARPRTGLTIVARDHGLLGNLLTRAGSGIERLPLEDPDFEGIFEVYGDDQVGGRVILTTTMLERLKALDELGHARGFACAFRGEHLLIAFTGMTWRCPVWRILQPVDAWLRTYATWLTGLVELPRGIVETLNLLAASGGTVAGFVPEAVPSVLIAGGTPEVFTSPLWRIVGEGGTSLYYIASGAMFGGVALVGVQYGLTQGYSRELFWYWWFMIALGVAYGVGAVGAGLWQLAQLAWKWNSPLRTLKRR